MSELTENAEMFRERLRNRALLLGTLVSQPLPTISELLAGMGWDWLFLDAEHGGVDHRDYGGLLRAAGSTPCLIRVAEAGEVAIKHALDAGAAGVIVPQVNSAERAKRVVQWSRYAPSGSRGVGISRAHGYGQAFQDYLEAANEAVSVVVQIEHIDAVNALDAILAVPGIDAVLVGPYDLSATVGRMGEVTHPEVAAAVDRVTGLCREADMPLGIFGISADAVRPWIAKGYTLVTAGTEMVFLAEAAKKQLHVLRSGE